MGKLLLALAVSGSAFFTVSYDFAGTGNFDTAKLTEVHCWFNTSCSNGATRSAGVALTTVGAFGQSVWKATGTFPDTHFAQTLTTYSTGNGGGGLPCVRVTTTEGYCLWPGGWSATDQTIYHCSAFALSGDTQWSCGDYVDQRTCTGGFTDTVAYTVKLEINGTTGKISKNGTQCGTDVTSGLNDYSGGSPGILFNGGTVVALQPTDDAVWTDPVVAFPPAIINAFLKGGGWLLRHP